MPRRTPALNRLSGWSLRSAVELDRSGHRGLVADLFRTSPIKMHAICGWMAVLDAARTPSVQGRVAGEKPNIADHLRNSSARELLASVFQRRPPSGYLRALLKARPEPFRLPGHYTRLFELFADEPDSFKTNALRFVPSINSSMIEAVDELSPPLVVPAVIASIGDNTDLQLVNRVFEYVQQRCATSEAVAIFGRYGVSRGLDKALERCLRKVRFPPPPLIAVAGNDC